jgi:hypothetical protein
MRGYSVATAALALSLDAKWLDNLLSQNRVDGVSHARQGVQRRLAPSALHVIATVHHLNHGLRIPVATALRLAHELWSSPGNSDPADTATVRADALELHLNRAEMRERVAAALAEALEMAPRTRRGRPPGGRTTARKRVL